MSTNTAGEGKIRKGIIKADIVDCMIALPGQLFYTTQIPVCLWFVSRNKRNGRFSDRRGKTLLIDARNLGTLVDRVHRELSDEEIDKIAGTYHAWRGEKEAGEYEDAPGFCKSATIDTIKDHGYVNGSCHLIEAEDRHQIKRTWFLPIAMFRCPGVALNSQFDLTIKIL
jgi:type I restriction enzyme M protein